MNPQLPPFPLDSLRNFLASIGFARVDELCDQTSECWAKRDWDLIRFPITEDPMYFMDVAMLLEGQMGMRLSDIEFYAKEIAQRFDPEGRHG